MNEAQIQAECFKWLWNNFPDTRRCFFHVPNGGKRTIVEAAQLKAMGTVAGIPDCLFVWNGRIHAFEFKDDKGRVSIEQEKVHAAWDAQGVKVVIIRELPTFQKSIYQIINKL